MNIWKDFWENTDYESIVENPPKIAYGGTNTEPLASQGMAYFLEACKDKFKEGFTVLDYGSGAGILSNFLSERLKDFNYYGLEPDSNHGKERIEIGSKLFKDERVFLGIIEKDLEFCLSKKPDAIILISVFTHLKIEDTKSILDNLIKVFDVNPDCDIIFSCFLGDIDFENNHQPNIWERYYSKTFIKESHLHDYCEKNNLKLTKAIPFDLQGVAGGTSHDIFKINRG